VEDCDWLVQYLDCSMEHYSEYSVALDSAFVVVFAEPVEADPVGSVEAGLGFVGPAEVGFEIVAALAEAVAVLVLDIVVVVPDIVAAVESGQNNAAEVVELEVDRVVVAVIDPGIAVVVVVSVLDIAVAKDVVVDSIGAVAGTVAMGTAEQ